MKTINYSTAWQNLLKIMDRICQDHESVVITRKGESAIVNRIHR